jgi:RNA polymerase sigma factor (sigma-70 family)
VDSNNYVERAKNSDGKRVSRGNPAIKSEAEEKTPEGAVVRFEEFFADRYRDLFRGMWILAGDPGEGEDLAQEAMARAFENWEKVRRADDPIAYVYRIGINLHRRRLRRARVVGIHAIEHRNAAQDDSIGQVEDSVVVMSAIRHLPRNEREILVLVEWLGLTHTSAASILRISPSSARGRMHRAKKNLRAQLGGLYDSS